MEKILDIYTDYLQATFRQATSTGLSSMLDGAVSHDQVTRMLSQPERGSKELWLAVKPLVRHHENDVGCLIFDDSIIEKPHTDESELVCWHFDHTQNRSVKGINLLTAFYHSQAENASSPLRVPVAFETVRKPIRFCDLKTRKQRRRSTVTKNELLRNMVDQALQNQLKFRYVLADSWFASAENMRFIHRKGKYFIFDAKCNRKAALNDDDRQQGRWTRIDELPIPEDTPVQVWLKDLEIPVILVKQVFTN
ncbi:MAG: transposase, partial [Planctomycetota bacterium]